MFKHADESIKKEAFDKECFSKIFTYAFTVRFFASSFT